MTDISPLGTAAERQAWLDRAVVAYRKRFASAGYTVPDHVRVAPGWPVGSRSKRGGSKTVGECYPHVASADRAWEIFISPLLGVTSDGMAHKQSVAVLEVLSHELVHATIGTKHGHGKVFKKAATTLGHTGKMTSTDAGPALVEFAESFIAKHGTYPMGRLSRTEGRKIQTTRLLKCECPECGYVARVTAKWIKDAGAPVCPTDGATFTCDGGEDD